MEEADRVAAATHAGHEKIGQGTLGVETFRAVVTNERLRDLPMILETPNDLDGYAAEIALLRRMAAGEAE